MNKSTQQKKDTQYPYLPGGREILYVPVDNQYILVAKVHAKEHSLDKVMPGAAVIVRNGVVIGMGANGSEYHQTNECERVKQGMPSGQGYELCEGCHPKNHSEPSAIRDAQEKGHSIEGADLYLWGHWWCCEPCWFAMIAAGIKNVYLLEGSEILFDKNHPDNIVGKQFETTEE
jgi:deoxycytidylate deaminase